MVRGVFAGLLLLCSSAAWPLTIAGTLSLSSAGKALRPTEAVNAVVYFRPRATPQLRVPEQPYVMNTVRKQFVPRALPVIVGSSVRFPNRDPILHNAFSTANNNSFDTGLYGQGEGEDVRFNTLGLVRVYCNVHHSMQAHVLVLDTPYFVVPDATGRFVLSDLPAGDGELFVWHERAALIRKPLQLDTDLSLELPLNLSKRRVPPHLNKFGKPYRRAGSGAY
jgi:plastocyanin